MSPIIDPGNFQRILRRAVILPLVVMGALALLLTWQINRLLTTAQWVEHTDQVIAGAHVSEKLIVDLETGLRGYLLTGQREFLEPYERATATIGAQFADLRQLVSDNPAQQARLDEIRSMRERWEAYAREMLALREGRQDYEAGVRSGQGKRLVDSMRATFSAFVRTEEDLRAERTAAARRTTYLALGTGAVATIILGGALGVLTRRQLQTVSGSYAEALGAEQKQREWLSVTLTSIGDALIATDAEGRVTFMNPVAERVTGWRKNEAANRPLDEVFRIVNEQTRATVESPVTKVLREGQIVGLANHTILIAKDGTERPIDDSGAPIRDENGRISGVILVFRDITERKQAEVERTLADAERGRLREELIKIQADRLEELSTPLIPLTNQIVVMPLIGTIDEERAVRVVETLSQGVEARGARVVILDITGVPAVDARVAGTLINAAQAMRLLGAEAVLTGIRPGVAQALVGLGVNLAGLVTRKDLQSGLAFAREHLGRAPEVPQ